DRQEGLARYNLSPGGRQFRGPKENISDAIRKVESGNRTGTPAWQQALQSIRLPLYDVHWTPAVVLSKGGGKKGDETIRVGLPDGRTLPPPACTRAIPPAPPLYPPTPVPLS